MVPTFEEYIAQMRTVVCKLYLKNLTLTHVHRTQNNHIEEIVVNILILCKIKV